MPTTQEFNAIRISLASPEQVRSWSYGEVTKPETINYRTLRPEKDGLFCERIFGPTKDFECFCGKYKKVRYRGLICDRCGVEVTRAKVRRERMGHVVLAAPVSHIWFAKGTPSRLGLLLDLTPRNLERVLYFAQYIIVSVDEDARERALKNLRDQLAQEMERRDHGAQERVQGVRERLAEALSTLRPDVRQEYSILQEHQLQVEVGQEITGGTVLAASAEGEEPVAALYDEEDRIGLVVEVGEGEVTVVWRTPEAVQAQQQADDEIAGIAQERDVEREGLEEEHQARMDEVEDLCTQQLLPEIRFRELRDRYPNVFKSGMGAEALLEILKKLDLEALRETLLVEMKSTSAHRRRKAVKRLKVVEAFRRSGNKPEWIILTVLPVLPPDLRPMVQLDGGRFATSDLNDLYRRVINRNNRLLRLMELEAPDIIIRNEKRMLQEAVDALIDNGRRGRAIAGSHNHRLKSLSDLLRGKQGRFRQNLLGKRVDYSGRSVIVVGPGLRLDQCGLPKRMALELFKPFVMHRLTLEGHAANIKSAKRIVERARPEVWDILEEVIKDRPVLLNRAPTLHRLGIQAFQPVLIEGNAIQLHPLVCQAFNADFDGDQMAVHVVLSRAAVAEAKKVMLSTHNMLSPASGEPLVAPTLDMVMGSYYLTMDRSGVKGEGKRFNGIDEASLAHAMGLVDLRAKIRVRDEALPDGEVETTVGRLIFNEVLLPERIPFHNNVMDKKALKELTAECYRVLGNEGTQRVLDKIKTLGFRYATQAGITISISDIQVPEGKGQLLAEAQQKVQQVNEHFGMGLMSAEEQYEHTVTVWREASEEMQKMVEREMSHYGGIYLMASSGAKGNISQITQMAGMRGLMSDPKGRIIPLPITSSFREGLSVMEYFISTHGARKGLADTALRTADSGYLTRRLIDVCQDVIILSDDCGTTEGFWVHTKGPDSPAAPFGERVLGRMAAGPVTHPATGEILVEGNQEINEERRDQLMAAGVASVYVRSPLTCEAHRGACRLCYGRNLATGRLAMQGEAVGIIAAQSIGEPGTQLTMRTFHTGGVVTHVGDITSGLPRVEELFEARAPKGQAILSEIDGQVEITETPDGHHIIRVMSEEELREDHDLPEGYRLLVGEGDVVPAGAPLATPTLKKGQEEAALAQAVIARMDGKVELTDGIVTVVWRDQEVREYEVPASALLAVQPGGQVKAGEALTSGPKNPQDILRIQGKEAVQEYLTEEVQRVYRSQGVSIHDKHIEVVLRQTLRRVRVENPGDTQFLPGDLVDRATYTEVNERVLAEGGEPATASPVLLGITRASLSTDSWMAAASFQETARVLTEAAVAGMEDRLLGLKENVIIGRLIPARYDLSEEGRERLGLPKDHVMGYPKKELTARTLEDNEYLRTMEAALGI
ncbi:MAG: DNA-directed RNA polymerase subunit beta' [Dehalococcoidia bacterium]|nr:DNA-directed RNA polymerase subunit beta' [Dehalococcoidia bacterium]